MTDEAKQSNDTPAFTVGQRVVATRDIWSGTFCVAHRGDQGTIIEPAERFGHPAWAAYFEGATVVCDPLSFAPLPHPGDGLPVSAPTDDIGAEPLTLTGAAVNLPLREIAGDAALWGEVRRGLATVTLENYGAIFGATLNAGRGYEVSCDTNDFMALTNLTGDEPVTVVRVDTTDYRAERDRYKATLEAIAAMDDFALYPQAPQMAREALTPPVSASPEAS